MYRTPPPPVSQQVKHSAFRGFEVVRPSAKEGQVPSILGGGGRAPTRRRRARSWEGLKGRAGPSEAGGQRRRSCALVLGDEHLAAQYDPGREPRTARPAKGSVCPSWPAGEYRLMPQPGLLHLPRDGAPNSKQSAPLVPVPAPRGRLRCGAARGTLLGGALGGLLAHGRKGGPPSRGRGK